MVRLSFAVAVILPVVLLLDVTRAQAFELESVKSKCATEFKTLCKDVVPGQGRLLACLYAYEDKLSDSCAAAVYDASDLLEQVFEALRTFTVECREDAQRLCPSVKPGRGRIRACLSEHEAALKTSCRDALVRTP